MRKLLRIDQIFVGGKKQHLFKIFTSLPLGLRQIHQQIVATIARCSPWHIAFKIHDKAERLDKEGKNISRRHVALHKKIIAGQAAHRSPLDNSVAPLCMVAQECRCQMLYCVYCTRTERRLSVRFFHPHVKGGDKIGTDTVDARNVNSTFQAYMVYRKTWYFLHIVISLISNKSRSNNLVLPIMTKKQTD